MSILPQPIPDLVQNMEFAPQPVRVPSKVHSEGVPSLLEGTLPRPPSPEALERHGVIAPDGSLCVGLFKLPVEMMSSRLRDTARLTDRIPKAFPTVHQLQRVLIDSNIRIPPAALDFPAAFATFKRAMDGDLRGVHFTDTARTLDRLAVGQSVSPTEISALRSTLLEAAHIATVCVGIDATHFEALNYRSRLQRGKDWLVDKVGATKVGDPRIHARLTSMLFEDLSPMEIRVDTDVWAQRLSLSSDGSTLVRTLCAAEHNVADVLSSGSFERVVRSSAGDLKGNFVLSSSDASAPVFAVEHTIRDVFAALQLGQSASRLLTELDGRKVDLVRLCRFVDRETALGVRSNVNRLSPQAHARLGDVDAWAERFDSPGVHVFSDEERHELAILLLDAELCLNAVGHLQNVVVAEERRSFWRGLWPASVRDREVSCALELVNTLPAPLSNDCQGAATVVTNAAMLLGFSGEDRGKGAGWRVPENPLASLTWALNRAV